MKKKLVIISKYKILLTYELNATDGLGEKSFYLKAARHFIKFICMLADNTFNKLEIVEKL